MCCLGCCMYGFWFVLLSLVCYIVTVARLVGFLFVCCFGFLDYVLRWFCV